ncbi:MAG TPA: hypothetical protein VNA19_12390 [Pyrinomonadaceae bacterium]|jgi:hypothetical protein|nr:hypothetical protein [Pyrinomonadaceae bacterium]
MKRQFYVRRGVALVTFLTGIALVSVWLGYLSPVVEYLRSPAVDVEALMSETPFNSPHKDGPERYAEDEYAVYSAVIEDEFQTNAIEEDARRVLIIGETAPDSLGQGVNGDSIERSIAQLHMPDPELIDSYINRNSQRRVLGASFKPSIDYALISRAEVERLFSNQGGWWPELRQRYPNTYGLLSFSGVGFNADRTRALVFNARTCGGLCGTGTYFILTKHNAVWRVQQKTVVWIS